MNQIADDECPTVLRSRLAALRNAVLAVAPPAYLEEALRARLFATAASAVDPAPMPAPRSAATSLPRHGPWTDRWANWIAWPVSVMAATGLVSWMVYTNPAVAPEPVIMDRAVASTEGGRTATPFLALASFDDIDPVMRGEVVRTTLPRSTLAEFGLPVSPMHAAEPIEADFLVSADGGVLAVRFVDAPRR
ncbi:MAG: hypothetical protein ABI831_09480 [Betaproteobacteria bacterium]